MKYLLQILTLIFASHIFAQTNIKVNEKAPPITITNWIENVPNDKSLDNKFIVLEFWATWCGPCIAAVPHMNELQKKVKNNNLYFISITDESVEKVQKILKRVPFHSIVATDLSKQTQINFGDGIKGLNIYPLTVLIDNNGIIKWIGEPMSLTEDVMLNFLNNTLISVSDNNLVKITEVVKQDVKIESNTGELTFMQLILDENINNYFKLAETNSSEVSSQKMGNLAFGFKSYKLLDIFKDVFGYNNMQIPEEIASKKYNLLYKNTTGSESLANLETEILNQLNLKKHVNSKTTAINTVSISKKDLLEKTAQNEFSAKSSAGDKLIFTNYSIPNLVKELSILHKTPFNFDGNDDLKYDFIIETISEDAIIKSLKKYGFKIQKNKVKAQNIILK